MKRDLLTAGMCYLLALTAWLLASYALPPLAFGVGAALMAVMLLSGGIGTLKLVHIVRRL